MKLVTISFFILLIGSLQSQTSNFMRLTYSAGFRPEVDYLEYHHRYHDNRLGVMHSFEIADKIHLGYTINYMFYFYDGGVFEGPSKTYSRLEVGLNATWQFKPRFGVHLNAGLIPYRRYYNNSLSRDVFEFSSDPFSNVFLQKIYGVTALTLDWSFSERWNTTAGFYFDIIQTSSIETNDLGNESNSSNLDTRVIPGITVGIGYKLSKLWSD